MNREQRPLLFSDNFPLVGYLVSDLCTKAANLSREDLATAGIVALISSSNAYSPAAGAPFGTFARRRITGALAESMRNPGRSALSGETRMTRTIAFRETLAGQLGRIPTIDELASALGVGHDAVQKALADPSLSLEPSGASAAGSLIIDTHSPEYFFPAAENRQLLHAAVVALPAAMRHIMEQLYLGDGSITSLADEVGTSPRIVAQQRSDAIRLLRGETTYATVGTGHPRTTAPV